MWLTAQGKPGNQMSAATAAPAAVAATQRLAETSGSRINIHCSAPMIQPAPAAAAQIAADPINHWLQMLIKNWVAMKPRPTSGAIASHERDRENRSCRTSQCALQKATPVAIQAPNSASARCRPPATAPNWVLARILAGSAPAKKTPLAAPATTFATVQPIQSN